jgi:hypothetical protein
MLRSWTASIAALFVVSTLIGCSSDSSAPAAQQTPAEDAASEPAEEASTGPDAQPETSTPEDAAEEPEAAIKDCPIEKDLKSYVPCMCFDIFVNSVEEAYPGCTKTVKCCPLGGGEIKCE